MTTDRYAEICASHRWDVPAHSTSPTPAAGAGRTTGRASRVYWEDESGATAACTFWDLQQQANRLSNALAALGVGRGDKVALILPQRTETIVAHIAVYQLGAVAVPLSFLFGPDALAYRLGEFRSEGRARRPAVAAEPDSDSRRGSRRSSHVIGVAGARESFVTPYEALLARRREPFDPVATAARRSGAADLHQRHDRAAQRRADAASVPARQPAGLRPFARRLSAAGRPLLVAGRLGVDRRPDGRAAAGALLRPADRRLPRPLRSRARAGADREIPDPERVPVPDRAQDDDEGLSRGRASASTSICAAS